MTQNEAFTILKSGANVYLTGGAGSGKTYLLNQYIEYAREHDIEVAVTASTGIAATHMNGMTIHSWSGLGIRKELSERDLDDLEGRQYLWKRFEKTKILVIDEVSMLHARQLDMIERIARTFKRNEAPFGGMQVILCGDFFQLPPIAEMGTKNQFVDQSEAWKMLDIKICYLTEQFRQSDTKLTTILNEIRNNSVSESTMEYFRSRYKKGFDETISPTKLYTHNENVDSINEAELGKLSSDTEVYTMSSRGNDTLIQALKKGCLSPETLRLKVGAKVMFVKNNYEKGYVNGTLGVVTGFTDMGPVVTTKDGKKIHVSQESWRVEEDGKVKAEITQIPLRLAWAITIHKSQGMSLDAAEIDLSKSFVKGQGYVALSRLRSLEGLSLMGLNKIALEVDEDVHRADFDLQNLSESINGVFKSFNEDELKHLHESFIIRSEGSLKADKKKAEKKKLSTFDQTRALLEEKKSIKEITEERGLTEGTVMSHIEKIIEAEPSFDIGHLKPDEKIVSDIEKAFKKTGDTKLTPVYEILRGKYPHDTIRLVRLFVEK